MAKKKTPLKNKQLKKKTSRPAARPKKASKRASKPKKKAAKKTLLKKKAAKGRTIAAVKKPEAKKPEKKYSKISEDGLKQLIERGRPRGFVTDNEILYYFPNVEES